MGLIWKYADATSAAAVDGGERLHWGWVLVPAIITHGTYDSVLFILATAVPGTPGTSEEEVPVSEMSFWELLEQVVLVPVGWIYLAVPLFWMRGKLVQADLPGLYAGAASRAPEMDGLVRGHEMLQVQGL